MSFKLSSLSTPSILFKNLSWLLSVEGAAKVARFITIFAMAAYLTPSDYGLAILCLAIHDVFRLLMKAGSGTQVIQCEQHKLKKYGQNAATIQWTLCLLLAVSQFSLAPVLADFYQKPDAAALLQLMALSYLFYPAVSIRVYLLQRANRFKDYSLVNGTCIITENLLVAVLLWFDFGLYAIAYAKIFAAFLWFALFMRVDVEHLGIGFQPAVMKFLLKTSSLLVMTELSKAAKQHADVFVAGRVLSPELFGFYTFAKTASLGMSQSFINAFQGALLPFLSQQNREGNKQGQRSVIIIGLLLSFAFVFQALSAGIYVPMLFGNEWNDAVLTCSILCLSAIPALWLDTLCSSLRARAEYLDEFIVRAFSLLVFAAAFVIIPVQALTDFALFTTLVSTLIAVLAFISIKLNLPQQLTKRFSINRSKL